MKDYNFYFKINLRDPRYTVARISSSLSLSQGSQNELQVMLAQELASTGYPAGSVEVISRDEYDEVMGWEGK